MSRFRPDVENARWSENVDIDGLINDTKSNMPDCMRCAETVPFLGSHRLWSQGSSGGQATHLSLRVFPKIHNQNRSYCVPKPVHHALFDFGASVVHGLESVASRLEYDFLEPFEV